MKRLFLKIFFTFILFFSFFVSFGQTTKFLSKRIDYGVSSMQNFWWDENKGSWKGGSIDPKRGEDSGMIDWWNAANSIEVLANSITLLPETFVLKEVMNKMFLSQNISGILGSKSYDDNGWVALSWLRAYEETGELNYYKRASQVYQEILTAWDDVCGGGLYWAGDEEGGGFRYKNAVTNELFIMLSMRMSENAQNINDTEYYFNWALKAWNWFQNSNMIIKNGSTYWIIDGLTDKCEPTGMYWTYNQGIILGGLGKLFEKTKNPEFAELAEKIIFSIIDENIPQNPWLYEGGILRENCEPVCSNSAMQFKGIFVRYIDYFYQSCAKNGRKIDEKAKQFISTNAEAMWTNSRDEMNRFGLIWKGPVNETNAIQQTAGIDLLIADHRIKQRE